MDCAPHLLELPLHLGVMTFGAVMMGLNGHDIRVWYKLRQHLEASAANGQFTIEDNGIRRVDIAIVVVGAFTFVWGITCVGLAAKQFKGRKGNYTGEGTAAWLPVTMIYLLLLGAWAGLTSAYTAYANTRKWSLTAGPKYAAPFSEGIRFLLWQINQTFQSSNVNSLFVPDSYAALGLPGETFAPWNTVTTIEQANGLAKKYLRYQIPKATVICAWFTLAIVFTATVVHFAMPFVLRLLGWTRADKRKEEARQLEEKEFHLL